MDNLTGTRSGPLEGIKVVDFSRYQNGPHGTLMLSDFGAGTLFYHEAFNRGKRSVTVDLRNEASREIVERLVKWADVLTENFKPGVMAKFGYSYEEVRKMNGGSSIIYASNSGFGPSGVWRERGSFDAICQAMSGFAVAQGGGPSHAPQLAENCIADQVGAMNFAYSIVAALLHRERHPQKLGQHLETSQLGAMLAFQSFWFTPALHAARGHPDAFKQRDDGNPPFHNNPSMSFWECSDGKWVATAPTEEKFWKRFVAALGRPDFATDPRSRDYSARNRPDNRAWVIEQVRETFRSKPSAHWVAAMVEHGVPCAPARDYADIAADADRQYRDNGYIIDVPHPKYEGYSAIGITTRFHDTPAAVPGVAPDLGAHNSEVLEMLGFGEGEIRAFDDAGATTPKPKARL